MIKGSNELIQKIQRYHVSKCRSDPVSLLTGALLFGDWAHLVELTDAAAWRHVLAALITHCDPATLTQYCGEDYYDVKCLCEYSTPYLSP